MDDEDVIESPEEATSGLTSALQLVDTTSVRAGWGSSATSITPLVNIRIPTVGELNLGFGEIIFRPISRPDRLQRALRDSLSENRDALEELSRY